jgi:putative transposase
VVRKSARRTGRTHSPAFKAQVALATLREDKTMADLEFPFMGARMLRRQFNRKGIDVGRRHIATLMQRMGIEPLALQPGASKRVPGHKVYPCLLRKLAIERSNQVWALETTYNPMARGFVYLTAVADVASRRVLAHKVVITLEACHAQEVIELAFARWGIPEIVNTDQGSQFTVAGFTDAVLGQGYKLSMDGLGAWRDNVFVERLWRSVKYGRVYCRRLLSCVAQLVPTERLALHGHGACLLGAPKMGDAIANEGRCEEQPAEVLGASGVCRRKGTAAQLVRRGRQGDLAYATGHQGPVCQRQHPRQQPGGVQRGRQQVPAGGRDPVPGRHRLGEIRGNPRAVRPNRRGDRQ